MKAQEKIARVERLLSRLSNQNRDLESYKDDLYYCFYECWHIKDHILNDDSVSKNYEAIDLNKLIHDECVNKSIFIKMCADIANREKHLKLKKSRVDGAINKSEIGYHFAECISVSVSVKMDLIHKDDLAEHDRKRNELDKINMDMDKDQRISDNKDALSLPQQRASITQNYFVINDNGETYDALEVIENALHDWKSFINSISFE